MEKELKRGELVGKTIEIVDSKNKANIGLKGKIINETKNMLEIKTEQEEKKKLIKTNITFKMENTKIEIRGADIASAPEERIKIR